MTNKAKQNILSSTIKQNQAAVRGWTFSERRHSSKPCSYAILKVISIISFYLLLLSCGFTNRTNNKQATQLQSRVSECKRTAVMDTVTVIINGKIIGLCDENPPPAMIYLSSTIKNYSLQADDEGRFKLNHIQAGEYKISATSIGHHRLKDTLIHMNSGEVWRLKIELGCEQ